MRSQVNFPVSVTDHGQGAGAYTEKSVGVEPNQWA